jgi:hypothetical protein
MPLVDGKMSEIKITPSIPLVFRENLSFHAEDLGSERTKEDFSSGVETAEVAKLTKNIVLQSLDLLDKQYWPKEIGIDFETWGRMYWPDGSMEELPISLIVSQQRPKDSRIRLGMHEILKDRDAQSSIVAHEMGHMLVEWIAGQLWKISDKQKQGKKVFGTVIDLLVSGQKMDSPEEFILLVSEG